MKSRTVFTIALWAVAAAGLAMTWHYERELAAANGRILSLKRDLDSLADRSANLRERLAKAEAIKQRLGPTHAANPKRPKANSGSGDWFGKLRNDPRVQARFLAYQRSGLVMKYGPLFQKLGLSPGQISKCEDNLIRLQGNQMDAVETLRERGLPMSDPIAAQLYSQMNAEYQSAQKEVLGGDGFARLASYESELQPRMVVNDYAGAATVAGIPLTASQLQQLTVAAIQASALAGPPSADGVDATDWASIDSQARTFLTPAQLSLMQTQELLGPFGEGTRFQTRLNNLITLADQADIKASNSSGGAGP